MEEKEQPKSENKKIFCCVGAILAVIFVVVFILLFVFFARGFFSTSADTYIPIPTVSQTKTTSVPLKTSNPSPSASVSKISDEDILNFFVEITTYNSATNKRATLSRWTKNPITIELGGNKSDLAVNVLNRIINDFNSLSQTKLAKVPNSGDIVINILPRSQIPKINTDSFKGYAQASPNSNCVINSANIYIDEAEMEGTEKFSAEDRLALSVRHELLHAVGFPGHDMSKTRGCTAISGVACLVYNYSEYDTAAIKMLYNSGVSLCSDENQIRQYFEGSIDKFID